MEIELEISSENNIETERERSRERDSNSNISINKDDHMDITPSMLTAQEVAKILCASVAWVYKHKDFLGGFQTGHYGLVRFSKVIISKIKEGTYALPHEKWKVASKADDLRISQNQGIFNQARSQGVGGHANRRNVDTNRFNDLNESKDPYGLLA
jgi:hypothetical protein